MLGLILVSGLGVLSLLFAMLGQSVSHPLSLSSLSVVLACFLLRKTHRRGEDGSQECDGKFRGISSRASFKAAIHRSLANQTHNTAAIVYTVDEYQGKHSLASSILN